jgi:glutamine synthetase
MHIHQSIVDVSTGKNIFSMDDGADSDLFRYAIGGLQKYLPASMALFAPYVNSYRRLVRDTAAPINVQWGRDNRTVGIRVPHSSVAARRVENRVVGADANPYIALATTLACCYLGMVNRLEPTPELAGNGYSHEYELPRSLNEAIDLLRETKELHDVLGANFVGLYTSVKELEHAEFMRVISPWERQHLLLHV